MDSNQILFDKETQLESSIIDYVEFCGKKGMDGEDRFKHIIHRTLPEMLNDEPTVEVDKDMLRKELCNIFGACADREANSVWEIFSDKFQDLINEEILRAHILRRWGRDKIKSFAKHLLGDKCDKCKEV